MTWTDAFRGIPRYAGTSFAKGDLAENLPRRKSIQRGGPGAQVLIAVGELGAIAERIEAQSAEIARLQNAGTTLDVEALRDYEAQQAAAERARVKTGVLVEDPQGDWAVLYGSQNAAVTQGHVSAVRQAVLDEAYSVHKVNAEGMLFDWDSGGIPGPDDLQEFPETLVEFQRLYARHLRRTLPDPEPRIPEDPITGEPGADRDERSA